MGTRCGKLTARWFVSLPVVGGVAAAASRQSEPLSPQALDDSEVVPCLGGLSRLQPGPSQEPFDLLCSPLLAAGDQPVVYTDVKGLGEASFRRSPVP